MKIALFTPLNPVRSGIADYNEELLPELRKHAEIDLYVDGSYTPSNRRSAIISPSMCSMPPASGPTTTMRSSTTWATISAPIAMSTRPEIAFPGIVVLHDYVLQGFYAEMLKANRDQAQYLELLQRYYPRDGARLAQRMIDRLPHPIWESELAMQFPLNEEIIGMAKGLIVHSEFLKRTIGANHSLPIAVIPHHGHDLAPLDRDLVRKELGFADHDLVLLSTGFVTRNKRYETIIPALSRAGHGQPQLCHHRPG